MSRGNAHTLSRVVPIAQRREARGITVTLSALELYEGGRGILRYLISHDPQTVFRDRFGGGPEPEIEARDGSGRHYGWGLDGYSGGDGETEGTLEIFDLPDSGELEIRVLRVVSTEPPEGAVNEAHEGPWEFRLSLGDVPTEERRMPEQEPPGYWKPAATTLERVVPVAQKRHVSGLMVALSYLEIHEGGNGFLRFLMLQDRPTRWRALTTPRLEVRVRDNAGRTLATQEDGSGSSMQSSYASLEAHASLLVFGLPDSGEIDIEVLRVANVKMDSPLLYFRMRLERVLRHRGRGGRFGEEGPLSRLLRRLVGEEGPTWRGPWTFRFRI